MIKKLILFFVVLVLASCTKKPDVPVTVGNKDTVAIQYAPEQPLKEPAPPPPEVGTPMGLIDGKEIAYDHYKPNAWTTDRFVVYIKNGAVKDTLVFLNGENDIGDNYVDEAEVVVIKGKPFIYINTSHTHGSTIGYLYSVNLKKKKALRIKFEEDKNIAGWEVPDSLTIHNGFELVKNDDNTFGFGLALRANKTRYNYDYRSSYKLVAKGNGQYVLKDAHDATLTEDQRGDVIKLE